jgi:hypothetical protein
MMRSRFSTMATMAISAWRGKRRIKKGMEAAPMGVAVLIAGIHQVLGMPRI